MNTNNEDRKGKNIPSGIRTRSSVTAHWRRRSTSDQKLIAGSTKLRRRSQEYRLSMIHVIEKLPPAGGGVISPTDACLGTDIENLTV